MAEKTDLSKLSKKELQEMLRRQERLLANKKFLQSLPDRGKKVTETVAKLRELITRKEQLEDTVAQFERMTVSRLVQRTRRDILYSDDSDDDMSAAGNQAFMNSTKDKHVGSGAGPDLHKKTESKRKKTIDCNKLEQKHTGQSLGRKWDYESSATPPAYKLEKTKPISLDTSFKLLQDQEQRYKDLQAQHATLKLKEQVSFAGTDHASLQVVQNPLQYREAVQDNCLSDDSEQEENDRKPTEMDSDDDEDNKDDD